MLKEESMMKGMNDKQKELTKVFMDFLREKSEEIFDRLQEYNQNMTEEEDGSATDMFGACGTGTCFGNHVLAEETSTNREHSIATLSIGMSLQNQADLKQGLIPATLDFSFGSSDSKYCLKDSAWLKKTFYKDVFGDVEDDEDPADFYMSVDHWDSWDSED